MKAQSSSYVRDQSAGADGVNAVARQLDRLMRWAQLSLLKLARAILEIAGAWAPIDRATQDALAPQIAKLEKFILALIMLKAGTRILFAGEKVRVPSKRYGPQRSRHNARRLFGARLRKACEGERSAR